MNMKHLYTELDALSQSGSVTDNSITDDSVIEIYFDNTNVYLKTISQSGHVVSFTVDGNIEGTNVCVVVNNLTNFVPYDDTSINNRMESIESDIDTITTELETIDTELETIDTEIETLDNKVNNLSASTINYDEHSTLYSAMGDIDDLQTTSKNLVGAINEVKESGGGGGSEDIVKLNPSDIFEFASGCGTQNASSLIYKKGRHLFGTMMITAPNFNNRTVGSFKQGYRPLNPTGSIRFTGTSGTEWGTTSGLYAYTNGRELILSGSGGYAILNLNYIVEE